MNKIYFDFEFIESGPENPIYPISLGMIKETGEMDYIIFKDIPWHKANQWVLDNIAPTINKDARDSTQPVLNRDQAKQRIIEFAGERPQFWGYFCSYDWVLMSQIHGIMMELPNNWPMHPMDLKQEMVRLGVKRSELNHIENEQEHHALADAVWNRSVHKYLIERANNEQKGPRNTGTLGETNRD